MVGGPELSRKKEAIEQLPRNYDTMVSTQCALVYQHGDELKSTVIKMYDELYSCHYGTNHEHFRLIASHEEKATLGPGPS